MMTLLFWEQSYDIFLSISNLCLFFLWYLYWWPCWVWYSLFPVLIFRKWYMLTTTKHRVKFVDDFIFNTLINSLFETARSIHTIGCHGNITLSMHIWKWDTFYIVFFLITSMNGMSTILKLKLLISIVFFPFLKDTGAWLDILTWTASWGTDL